MRIIFDVCHDSIIAGFSAIFYVNYKSDADSLARDLRRMSGASGQNVSEMAVYKHYTGLSSDYLERAERIVYEEEDSC